MSVCFAHLQTAHQQACRDIGVHNTPMFLQCSFGWDVSPIRRNVTLICEYNSACKCVECSLNDSVYNYFDTCYKRSYKCVQWFLAYCSRNITIYVTSGFTPCPLYYMQEEAVQSYAPLCPPQPRSGPLSGVSRVCCRGGASSSQWGTGVFNCHQYSVRHPMYK